MSTGSQSGWFLAQQYLDQEPLEQILARLRPRLDDLPPRLPGGSLATEEAIARRWQRLAPECRPRLLDAAAQADAPACARNIEYYVGQVRVPLGLAGPLRVNGLHARGDFLVPLATTEAALVASYGRGAQVITEAGGCTALVLSEGVMRAPAFAFRDLGEAGSFAAWAANQLEAFQAAAHATTRHGRLRDLRITVEGNHVYLAFQFTTGDAAGQNMVTIATQAICEHILAQAPVQPRYWFVEGNASGDKKASSQSFTTVRGKKVAAEVLLPEALVRRRLHCDTGRMVDYWRMSAMGGVLTGTLGIQGHYANGLAALFIACGQDAACVAEAAVGTTRFERLEDGSLYAAVTLPNLIVGTVGGGTGLPTQRACLELLGLAGEGHARAFAEVAAALSLAGELSIIAALASGEFTRAHSRLARGKDLPGEGTE
jgi:hydroxymethylglutaryl-CoA reductase (NADPH)